MKIQFLFEELSFSTSSFVITQQSAPLPDQLDRQMPIPLAYPFASSSLRPFSTLELLSNDQQR